ncbi:unnamed protein product [Symbiodinium sp. CCMP2592]|nr:unnamed protein product [Symbiodinium sp. CCMP2592]
MVWHEDAVPNYHDESAAFWSWSVPLNEKGSLLSRHCFIGLPSSRICAKTREAVLAVLEWDLRSLKTGCFADRDHLDVVFPENSFRGKRAKTPIMGDKRAIFSWWKGDQEAHMLSHRLRRNYLTNNCCDLCLAQKRLRGLTYADFTMAANWRRQMHEFLGMASDTPFDNVLFTFTARAKLWARDRRLDVHIKPLTVASLGKSDSANYPELSSRIKASRTRNLLAFVTHFAIDVERAVPWTADADFIHWNQVRAAMLWSLDSALSLFGKGQRPFLARHEASQGTALLQLHLELWQRMARQCLLRKQTLYIILCPRFPSANYVDGVECSIYLEEIHDVAPSAE